MIQDMREIIELARIDLAHAEGGPLTPDALRMLSYWIVRAWEAGVSYGKRQR